MDRDRGDGQGRGLHAAFADIGAGGQHIRREAVAEAAWGVAVPIETEESDTALRHQVIDLAVPALVEMLLMTTVSMANMIMVGRLGPWAITSVGLSNQPLMVAQSVFMALNVGTTAVVARSVGAGKQSDAARAARQALVVATLLGLAMAAAGVTWAPQILAWMGAQEDVLGPAVAYFRAICLSLVFQGAAISLTASLRGAGDTKTPMTVNVAANLVAVAGNWLLIYGNLGLPRLGVTGAGVATIGARLVALCLITSRVFGRRPVAIRMSLRDRFMPDAETMGRILKVGIPAAIEQLVMRSGQMTFARIVASFGTSTYAARQVALNIEGLSFNPPQAFQVASTTLVGQSLGANKPDRASRVAREAVKIAMACAVVTGAILFFFGRYIALLYTDDPTVIALSTGSLRIIAFVQPFMALNFVLVGALRGAGDVKWALYITMAGIWGVRVTMGYLLALGMDMGLIGAWIAMAMDMTTRAILVALRFRTGRWKTLTV